MENDSSEVWKPVAGFGGVYEVSSHGRVRSLDHQVEQCGYTRTLPGRILRTYVQKHGYVGVGLNASGQNRTVRIHRLVAETFMPEGNGRGLHVCHYDGDKTNNHVDNLRWDTKLNNERDKRRHGTHNNGKKTHCKWGHEFTEKNTALLERRRRGVRSVERVCRQCGIDRRHRLTEQRTAA